MGCCSIAENSDNNIGHGWHLCSQLQHDNVCCNCKLASYIYLSVEAKLLLRCVIAGGVGNMRVDVRPGAAICDGFSVVVMFRRACTSVSARHGGPL